MVGGIRINILLYLCTDLLTTATLSRITDPQVRCLLGLASIADCLKQELPVDEICQVAKQVCSLLSADTHGPTSSDFNNLQQLVYQTTVMGWF